MPWARIDDAFDDHPKVLALLEHDDGAAAIGLWTLCLAWAHRNTRRKGKVPGRIPASLPRRYLGTAPGRGAAKLLAGVGLWDVVDDGWDIHDFDQYLPTAETSSARSEAGRRGAAARWGKQGETAGADSKLLSADGKLSSDVMANDGNVIASDGSGMAPEGAEAATPPPDPGTVNIDGKLPPHDSNEPSEGGKPIASDGSRAPARRAISKEIAPTPEPTPGSQEPKDIVPAKPPRDDATRLCEHLAARMIGNGCKPPAITRKWLDAARLLIDNDGRTEDQVHAAIDWCQDSEFWRGNIRSMPTLREQYDQLRLQAARDRGAPRASTESTGAIRGRDGIEAGLRVQARIDGRTGT